MPSLTITVTIADRPYRLKVEKQDEEKVRKSAKTINEKIKAYAETYAYKDKQDLLAMIALQFASFTAEYESEAKLQNDLIIENLTSLEQLVTDCLNKE
jgi:cell division protein ZapA (FtsZ GTPase activity inhibitor)